MTLKSHHQIIVCEAVRDTVTNAGGLSLYQLMVEALRHYDVTELSFKGAGGLSTSFLNSSLGTLIDENGFDVLKRFRPVHLSRVQMDMLKRYLENIKEHQA